MSVSETAERRKRPLAGRILFSRLTSPPHAVARDITTQIVIQDVEMVVKELLENALDAGATTVRCVVTQGGTCVELSDDGPGISFGDMGSVGVSHSTSKLSTLADLKRLETYGFRGEGLHAIASQGLLRVCSRVRGATQGYAKALSFAAGAEFNEPVAVAPSAAEGTVVRVEQLFATLPVRRQVLLEKQETAYKNIVQLFTGFALAHPTVSFRLEAPPRPPFVAEAKATLEERFTELYGPDLLRQMERVRWTSDDVEQLWEFDCMLPKPALADYGHAVRSKPRVFATVNKRPVKLDVMTKLVNKMFRAHAGLTARKYPFILMALTLPPDTYDINLSVEKSKINLLHEERLLEFLTQHLEDRYPPLDSQLPSGSAVSSGGPVFGVGGALDDFSSPARSSLQDKASAASTPAKSPQEQQLQPHNAGAPNTPLMEVQASPPREHQVHSQSLPLPLPLPQSQQQQQQQQLRVAEAVAEADFSPPQRTQKQQSQESNQKASTVSRQLNQNTPDRLQDLIVERRPAGERVQAPLTLAFAEAEANTTPLRGGSPLLRKVAQRPKDNGGEAAAVPKPTQPRKKAAREELESHAVSSQAFVREEEGNDFVEVGKRQKTVEPESGRAMPKDMAEVNMDWMAAQSRAVDVYDARYRGQNLTGSACLTAASQRVVLSSFQLVSARIVGIMQNASEGFLAMVDGTALVLCDSIGIFQVLHYCHHVAHHQVPTAPLSELVFLDADAIGSSMLWDLVRTNRFCHRMFQKNGFVMDTRYFDTRVNKEVIKVSGVPRCIGEERCRDAFVELLKLVGTAHVNQQLTDESRLHAKAVLDYFQGEANRLALLEIVGVAQKAHELLESLAATAASHAAIVKLAELDVFRQLFHFSTGGHVQ